MNTSESLMPDEDQENTLCLICKKETYNWTTNAMGASVYASIGIGTCTQDSSGPADVEEDYGWLHFCGWKCLTQYCIQMLALEDD
jgi:hypothetical protein